MGCRTQSLSGFLVLTLLFPGVAWEGIASEKKGGKIMALTITSEAFKEGGMIPKQYTCDGTDISPPLEWSGVPEGTKSLALICDDPDAPVGTWVHWVLYDLPPELRRLPTGVPPDKTLEKGGTQGINDFRRYGYGGPCPPGGTHRYYFKLYALDIALKQAPGLSKAKLLEAVKGHVLAEGELMGQYKR